MNLTLFAIKMFEGDPHVLQTGQADTIDRYLRSGKPGQKTAQIQFKLPTKTKRRASTLANKRGLGISDFVRQVLIYGRRDLLDG
jgi:hypothetical protein